eukprot:6408412-Pyramimonas_sp.AAC.1
MAPNAIEQAIGELAAQVGMMNESLTKVTEQVSELAVIMKSLQEGLNLQKKKLEETEAALAAMRASATVNGNRSFDISSDDSRESSAKKACISARSRIGNQDLLSKATVVGYAVELIRAILLKSCQEILTSCASAEVLAQMKVTPQNFSKRVIIAFPSGDAAYETIDTFRQNYPDGYSYTTPDGPSLSASQASQGWGTEVESVGKFVPQPEGWKVDSSVGNGFIFIANESTGDALTLHSVQKPPTVFEQPRAIAFDRHFEKIGLAESSAPVEAGWLTREVASLLCEGRFVEANSCLGERGESLFVPFPPKKPISIATWNARGPFASVASMRDRSRMRWRIFSALLRRNHIVCIQESHGHEGDLVSLRKEFTSHMFFFSPHPDNLQGHGILVCAHDKLACQFSGFAQKVLYPGEASYVLCWGEAGLLGIVVVHLPNVDAGI